MAFAADLLSRVEDASLNASAVPQQRWIDGWLVRYGPVQARRARSVQPLADGRLPLADKLALAAEVYAEAGLPMHLRITPFARPEGLDTALEALGWAAIDPTWVMVRTLEDHPTSPTPETPTARVGSALAAVDHATFAEVVGAFRDSPPSARQAHAQRLQHSPTPYRGYVLYDDGRRSPLACAQFAREGRLVGLYDVFTAPGARGRGWASLLCERLLATAAAEGARIAYLQVSADNEVARRLYRRLGFADAYGYHYRVPPSQAG